MKWDVTEHIDVQADDEQLEERVTRYLKVSLGKPEQSSDVWNSIADRLGEQEGSEAVEFARSLNGLYAGEHGATQNLTTGTRRANHATPMQNKPVQQQRWRQTFHPGLAAGVVLAIIGILATVLALSSGGGGMANHQEAIPTFSPTPVPPLNTIELVNPGFESGFLKWSHASPGFAEYQINADNSVVHEGASSVSISSTNVLGTGLVNQYVDTSIAAGKRIRFSGYIKTQDVSGAASLFMFVNGVPQQEQPYAPTVAGDWMTDRAPVGTTDWTRYGIVLDVPGEASNIGLGASLLGSGRMWVDDLRLEVVSKDIPSTDWFQTKELANGDFEDGIHHWSFDGGYATRQVDNVIMHGGKESASLQQTPQSTTQVARLQQLVQADSYAGKRVRFSAYLKTEDVAEQAQLHLGVLDDMSITKLEDVMETRPVYGTTDWTEYDLVLDVPVNSAYLSLGVYLNGAGRIWIDDAKIGIVGKDVPTTNLLVEERLANEGFESGLQPDWNLISSGPTLFEASTGSEQAYTGDQGAYLRVIEGETDKVGALLQTIDAAELRGKTIVVSAYINADKVKSNSYLWAKIYAPDKVGAPGMIGEAPLWSGQDGYTGGWIKREIELNVPEYAETITLGVKLTGVGEVWIDNVAVESQ